MFLCAKPASNTSYGNGVSVQINTIGVSFILIISNQADCNIIYSRMHEL